MIHLKKKKALIVQQQMKIPAAIARTIHSTNHVIYIVILTCRLFLFLYHLHVNPIHSFLPMMKKKIEKETRRKDCYPRSAFAEHFKAS